MSRRRYLIAYDIADDRRLRRVCSVMESYGERLPYSVFMCDLTVAEQLAWRREILGILNLGQDSIVKIDLGVVERPAEVECIGVPRSLPRAPGRVI